MVQIKFEVNKHLLATARMTQPVWASGEAERQPDCVVGEQLND
jgi:hypothetical protein